MVTTVGARHDCRNRPVGGAGMGRMRLFTRQREGVSNRHRIKAAALVVALAGGLFAIGTPPASAATITQNGSKNHAGPAGTCPDVTTWTCAVIAPDDGNIVVNQTSTDP